MTTDALPPLAACTGFQIIKCATKSSNSGRVWKWFQGVFLTMPNESPDRLADSIDSASVGLVEELKAVRDSVEELMSFWIMSGEIGRNFMTSCRQSSKRGLRKAAKRHPASIAMRSAIQLPGRQGRLELAAT